MLFTKTKPMLAIKGDKPFDSEQYFFELKVDGIRIILHADFENGRLKMFTRHGNCCTAQFPEFQNLSIPGVRNIILDGELCILTNGRPDFNSPAVKSPS